MSSGFITETELAEARKKRQEEWEKVRRPDQPIERPEEPYDSRPLYERLKEQRLKKEFEFEEAHKLKNLIRGLDDDEIEFLDLVDRTKMKVEKQQQIEEAKELKEFRERVASLQEHSVENKIQTEVVKPKPRPRPTITAGRPSQKSLIGNILRKRKNGEIATESRAPREKAQKLEETSKAEAKQNANVLRNVNSFDKGALKCIGILPGIGRYKDSSDSEVSSDSEEEAYKYEKFDLVGRKNTKQKKKSEDSE